MEGLVYNQGEPKVYGYYGGPSVIRPGTAGYPRSFQGFPDGKPTEYVTRPFTTYAYPQNPQVKIKPGLGINNKAFASTNGNTSIEGKTVGLLPTPGLVNGISRDTFTPPLTVTPDFIPDLTRPTTTDEDQTTPEPPSSAEPSMPGGFPANTIAVRPIVIPTNQRGVTTSAFSIPPRRTLPAPPAPAGPSAFSVPPAPAGPPEMTEVRQITPEEVFGGAMPAGKDMPGLGNVANRPETSRPESSRPGPAEPKKGRKHRSGKTY